MGFSLRFWKVKTFTNPLEPHQIKLIDIEHRTNSSPAMAKIGLFLFGVVLLSSMVNSCQDKERESNCIVWKDYGYCGWHSYVKENCQKSCGICGSSGNGKSRAGNGRKCAYFYNCENAGGCNNLKVLSGTEEDGEEVGTHKRPNGYKTNMSVSPWVNNYNNGWEVKAVKVYKGCTLQAFREDNFK